MASPPHVQVHMTRLGPPQRGWVFSKVRVFFLVELYKSSVRFTLREFKQLETG